MPKSIKKNEKDVGVLKQDVSVLKEDAGELKEDMTIVRKLASMENQQKQNVNINQFKG